MGEGGTLCFLLFSAFESVAFSFNLCRNLGVTAVTTYTLWLKGVTPIRSDGCR